MNGDWLYDSIQRIEAKMDDLISRVALLEGAQQQRRAVWPLAFMSLGVVVSLVIGVLNLAR